MPVFNSERFVAEAIKSVLNQTFKDFEFLILDDASTDKSIKIIKYFEKKLQLYIKNYKQLMVDLKKEEINKDFV